MVLCVFHEEIRVICVKNQFMYVFYEITEVFRVKNTNFE